MFKRAVSFIQKGYVNDDESGSDSESDVDNNDRAEYFPHFADGVASGAIDEHDDDGSDDEDGSDSGNTPVKPVAARSKAAQHQATAAASSRSAPNQGASLLSRATPESGAAADAASVEDEDEDGSDDESEGDGTDLEGEMYDDLLEGIEATPEQNFRGKFQCKLCPYKIFKSEQDMTDHLSSKKHLKQEQLYAKALEEATARLVSQKKGVAFVTDDKEEKPTGAKPKKTKKRKAKELTEEQIEQRKIKFQRKKQRRQEREADS
eukprot:GDKH01019411.1.p1 GENE.GDKH01019411.1~~GDKH01019411.1.p1  ORF type:complete len:263 (-),score=60.48 GDKH01019411.1:72-860(-)